MDLFRDPSERSHFKLKICSTYENSNKCFCFLYKTYDFAWISKQQQQKSLINHFDEVILRQCEWRSNIMFVPYKCQINVEKCIIRTYLLCWTHELNRNLATQMFAKLYRVRLRDTWQVFFFVYFVNIEYFIPEWNENVKWVFTRVEAEK